MVETNNPIARPSLVSRVKLAGSWSILGFGLSQAIRLVSNLTMTRLLVPEAFGLVAIAISLQILIIMMSDLGINTSVIRSASIDDKKFLSTAFVTQILRACLIATIIFMVAGVTALLQPRGVFDIKAVYSDPRLPYFIIAVGVTSFFEGFRSLKVILCQRDLKMERVVILEIASQVIGFVTILAAIYIGFGPFSLIVGMLMASGFMTVGSHLFIAGPKIGFEFDKHYFKELFDFGKWLIIASFFGFLTQRGDQLIFGALMNSTNFGLYAVATIWVIIVVSLMDIVLTRIALPALSEVMRENPEKLKNSYSTFRLALDVACAIIFSGILLFSDIVFSILYPENFAQVGIYLKYLSIIILLLPYRLLNILVIAEGKSLNMVYITLLPPIVMMIGTPIVYNLTNEKTAIVFSTLSYLSSVPISWYFTKHLLKHSKVRESLIACLAIIAAIIMITVK